MVSGSFHSYYNSIVKIVFNHGGPAGAGVIIGKDRILTCAHVIADVLEIPHDQPLEETQKGDLAVNVARVFVDGQSMGTESIVQCRIIKYEHRFANTLTQDLAILETPAGRYTTDPPLSISHFSTVNPSQGTVIKATGFPVDAAEKVGQSVDATYMITGSQANAWLTSIAHESYGDEIRPGFSGAPVLDNKTKHLIGIICEADQARRTATIIPTSTIVEFTSILTSDESVHEKDDHINAAPQIAFQKKCSPLRTALEMLFPHFHYLMTVKFRFLEDPPERAYLEARLSEQRAEWAEEMKSKTYLPPPAKEVPTAPEQIQLKKGKFFTPIQQLIKEVAGVSTGGDSASAQISAISKKSRRIRNLVNRLESSREPLIVLGDPGSGKTITLKQVAIEISGRNAKRVSPTLCLFIPLGRWKPIEKPGISDIEKLVEENAGPTLAPLINELSDRQRLIIIFDGIDEMSRYKYNEHTKALSKYAERYKGKIKTLFSCRIADFSPAFKHNRLVLLPFNIRHITQYLLRQFGNINLTIANETIPTRKLGKRLVYSSLPIQPQNPFSLWLLSLYLREEQKWPDTRTTLLRFLYDYQYDRKAKDQINLIQEKKEEYFKAWGRLALMVTRQNRGTDIGLHSVRSMFGNKTDEIITAGRSCGILQQSIDTDPPLIRFEHHRAQEYFTARGVIESKLTLDWKELLLVPRWQETFVNIAQMSAGDAPLPALVKSMGESLHAIKKILDEKSDNHTEHGEKLKTDEPELTPFEKAMIEGTASEHIELSTRVIRAVPASKDKEKLTSFVHDASVWLAEKGNPTSQIKMLRLTNQLPDQIGRDVVEYTQKSRVAWVRNHSNEVAASISGSLTASPLPIETANAYGNGEILTDIFNKFGVARKLNSTGLAIITALSFILLIGNMFLTASITPVLTYAFIGNMTSVTTAAKLGIIEKNVAKEIITRTEADKQINKVRDIFRTYEKWVPRFVLVAVILSLIGSMIWEPSSHWILTGIAGIGTLLVSTIAYGLWIYAPDATLTKTVWFIVIVALCANFLYIVIRFAWILAATIVCIPFSLVLGFAISIWTRDFSYLKSTIGSIFRNGEYLSSIEDLIMDSVGFFGGIFFGAGIIAVIILIGWAVQYFAHEWVSTLFITTNKLVIDIPFSPRLFDYGVTIGLVIGILIFIFQSILLIHPSRRDEFIHKKTEYYGLSTATFAFAGLSLVGGFLVSGFIYLVGFLHSYFENVSVSWLLKALVAMLGFLLALALIGSSIYILYYLWRRHAQIFWTRTLHSTPSEFKKVMESNDTVKKLLFLGKFGPTELGISAENYFEILVDVETHMDEETVSKKYYQRRLEIEEIIRQERHG